MIECTRRAENASNGLFDESRAVVQKPTSGCGSEFNL
jgi:hypothetical protein